MFFLKDEIKGPVFIGEDCGCTVGCLLLTHQSTFTALCDYISPVVQVCSICLRSWDVSSTSALDVLSAFFLSLGATRK